MRVVGIKSTCEFLLTFISRLNFKLFINIAIFSLFFRLWNCNNFLTGNYLFDINIKFLVKMKQIISLDICYALMCQH